MVQYIARSGAGVVRQGDSGGQAIQVVAGSELSLNLRQDMILSMARRGGSLEIFLVNGQKVVVDGFFPEDGFGRQSQLFLSTDGAIQEINFTEGWGRVNTATFGGSDGVSNGLVFGGNPGELGTMTRMETAGGYRGGGFGGFGGGEINGGILAAGLAVPLAGMALGGGGSSGSSDTSAPTQPTVHMVNASGASGTAEAGSLISIDTNGDGVANYTTTTAADGTWSIVFAPQLGDGTSVDITAADAAGNVSSTAAVTVDAVAPGVPGYIVTNANGANGTAEAGSTIEIDVDGDGVADYTTTADASGNWAVTFNPTLPHGTNISVTATDTNGNASISGAASIDAQAPVSPSFSVLNGTLATGNAEPGSTIALDINGDGTADYTTTANASGGWSITISPALAHGATVTAISTDVNLNVSVSQSGSVDAVGPSAPVITSVNANGASGTSEANASVSIDVNNNGSIDYVTTADASGNWSVTFTSVVANGTQIAAMATDSNLNAGGTAFGNADTIAPNAPAVSLASDETSIIGSAEPGAGVSVSYVQPDGDLISLDPIIANASGGWSSTPNPSLAVGTELYVSATDAAGNESTHSMVMMGPAQTLDLSTPPSDIATGFAAFDIEAIDMSDTSGNQLVISEASLVALSGEGDTLRIDGQAGNTVSATGAIDTGSSMVIEGHQYDVYTLGVGTLLIDQDITNVMV